MEYKKTFRELKEGDTIYQPVSDISTALYFDGRRFFKYEIVEHVVESVEHTTEVDGEPTDYYVIHIKSNHKQYSFTVNLHNSTTYLYHYGTVFVNKEDAETFIKEYSEEALRQLNKEARQITEIINELNKYYKTE